MYRWHDERCRQNQYGAFIYNALAIAVAGVLLTTVTADAAIAAPAMIGFSNARRLRNVPLD